MAQYPLCNVQSVKAIWYRKPWNSGLFHAGWLLLSLDAGHGNRGGAYFGITCFSGIFWRYLHGRAPFRRNMNRKGETDVDKSLEEMDEQELSNLLVLMKAKGKNSYGIFPARMPGAALCAARSLRRRAGAGRRNSARRSAGRNIITGIRTCRTGRPPGLRCVRSAGRSLQLPANTGT